MMKVLGVGACSLEGPTHANEDKFVQFCGDEARVLTATEAASAPSTGEGPSFFAVYDGHAGDMVVTHVAQALHAHIFSPANRPLFFPSSSVATTDDAQPTRSLTPASILWIFHFTIPFSHFFFFFLFNY
jgi:hypothetical protein